ncbi:hypothetical protein FDECE_7471 [Fusarium decemcellulare]|nr:hypothetical protein FDECE_7471 [Fusarium decemcellulare]
MESANINRDNTPSPSSSIILEEPDLSGSIYGDKVDLIMSTGDDHEHPPPPTSDASMAMVLDPAAPHPPEDEDMTDGDGWTIVRSLPSAGSLSSASQTTCPAPASVADSVHNLTAANMLRWDLQNMGSAASPGSPAAPKRSNTRDSDMSPPDLTEPFSPASVHESGWGLCGIGAWADTASPAILAKNARDIPRQ